MASNRSILIVDDDVHLRQTLAIILQKAGYSVTTAGSGFEARRYLQAGPFDLVFLDLKMPDIDGIKLLPDIRKLYPDMPILVLTAHATLESAIEAVRQGARDYLLKPVEPTQIIDRVHDIIDESSQPNRRRKIVGEIQELLNELSQLNGGVRTLDLENLFPDPSATRFIQRGPFALDLHARHASLQGQRISLSPTAFDYLVTLLRHSPDPVSYEALVMESQGYQTNLVEARDLARWRIHELRKTIEADLRQPQYIITVRGVGYRLIT